MEGFEIRPVNSKKGKGLFASKSFDEGDIILEENPIVSCQFTWNAACKYKACDFCMRPLETAEENVRRLTAKPDIILPHPDCCTTNLLSPVSCDSCGSLYCSQTCKSSAFNSYHRVLCYNPQDTNHPLAQLNDAWKQIHYPPETTSIMLLLRILAFIKQSADPAYAISKIKQFCHRTVNEDAELAHKLLGEQFSSQLNTLREMTSNAMSGESIQEFLTPEGFCSLVALIGTNGQGIGTSAFAIWVNNVTELSVLDTEKKQLEALIDKLYEFIDEESGSFLNNEGSGLYEMQSACNHSCVPNAEPNFPFGNHRLQLRALRPISAGEEIFISYLDDCMLSRSRHSRQKELAMNYLFICECEKCLSQASDPDETSHDEMSEDEELEDMED